MSVQGENGILISFECTELIEELEEDIREFGNDLKVVVWCKKVNGAEIYTNYDFIDDDMPVGKNEIEHDEYLTEMTAGELLPLLKKQNDVV